MPLYGPGDVMRHVRMIDTDAPEATRAAQKKRIDDRAARCESLDCRTPPGFIDMAARRPATLAEFGDVFGVGRAKTEAFGEIFMALIATNRALSGDAA